MEIKFLRIFSLKFVVSFEDGLDAFKRAISYKEFCIQAGVMHGVKEIIFIVLKFWGFNEIIFEICIFFIDWWKCLNIIFRKVGGFVGYCGLMLKFWNDIYVFMKVSIGRFSYIRLRVVIKCGIDNFNDWNWMI